MPTYLLNWNPRKWEWTHFHEQLRELAERGSFLEPWDTGASRRLTEGDRVFLIRQGVEPRGIIASGEVRGMPYRDEHWTGDGRQANYVAIEWDQMFDPLVDEILARERLDALQPMHWDPQRSGTRIPDEVAVRLEREWARVTKKNESRRSIETRYPIIVVKLGAEGGGQTIRGGETDDGWEFWSIGGSMTFDENDEEIWTSHESGPVRDLGELVPEFWIALFPIEVHEMFVPWFREHLQESIDSVHRGESGRREIHTERQWRELLEAG